MYLVDCCEYYNAKSQLKQTIYAEFLRCWEIFSFVGGWLGKKAQNQEIALMGRGREASRLGKKVRNREKTPMGRVREASQLGKKVQNRENTPIGRVREASWLAKKVQNRENTPTGRGRAERR